MLPRRAFFSAALVLLASLPMQTQAGPPPDPWTGQDIGEVVHRGGIDFDGETYRLNGSGAEIWESADSFYFLSQPLNGSTTIVAHFREGLNFVDPHAKAGVMIRASLEPGAANVFLAIEVPPDFDPVAMRDLVVGLGWLRCFA